VSNFVFGLDILKFDDVVGVILSKEMQWKIIGGTSGNALIVDNKGRQRERWNSLGILGKYKKGRSKYIGKLECWNCGKKGHLKKDYWSWKGKQGDQQQENNQDKNVAGDVLNDYLIL